MKADVESEGSLDNNTTSGQSNSGEPSMEEMEMVVKMVKNRYASCRIRFWWV